jgi:subfamily B ATP-binding cassette protein MsbA
MNKTISVYTRIFALAKPYRVKLTVAIVAGLLSGGSLFGVLNFIPSAIQPFESPRTEQKASADGAPAPAETKKSRLGGVQKLADQFHIPTTKPDGTVTWQLVLLSILGLPFFVLIRGLSTFINRYYMRWVGARAVMDMRNMLFNNLQNQSLKFFGKCEIGNLISRCTNDTAMIEHAIATTIADMIRAPIEIFSACIFVVMFARSQQLYVVLGGLFLFFPLCIMPIMLLGRYVKRYTRDALRRISDVVSRMQENFTGIRVVKAFFMEQAESERFARMNLRYFDKIIKALRAELFMAPMMELVAAAFGCAFLVYCYSNHIMLSQILSMAAAAVFAYKPIKQLAKINVNIQKSVAAAERIFELLDTDTRLPEAENPVAKPDFSECIRMERVSFCYETGGKNVLDDVSLDVPRGSVVAFVGETGVGKTTIVNLLARFYDPTQGRILMDGIDLREIEVADLRRLVGIVTQETILFNDTVASNIAYGSPDATREEIEEAAKKANAHEFIMAEPEGYERVVGDKGFVLSGGQRQRVAIARAILKNPPILILDEATSALDTVTEQLVQEAIGRVMEHRTVFAVAHRLSTIKHADQICVLEKGRIIEHGTHDELYAASGVYRNLCDIQFSS